MFQIKVVEFRGKKKIRILVSWTLDVGVKVNLVFI